MKKFGSDDSDVFDKPTIEIEDLNDPAVNDAQPENIADEWGEDIGSTEGQGDE